MATASSVGRKAVKADVEGQIRPRYACNICKKVESWRYVICTPLDSGISKGTWWEISLEKVIWS